MFEIHKRHTPMFITSELKQIAQVLTETLGFENLEIKNATINPIFQTVRINENSSFIIRSTLHFEQVAQLTKDHPVLAKLRLNKAHPEVLIESITKKMIEQFKVDSYFCIGGQTVAPGIDKLLSTANSTSKKPLIIFNSTNNLQYKFTHSQWYDMDHPAIWLNDSLGSNMNETEAFFAMSPTLKLEVELNRYQTLESFGSFSLGMVRF